MSETNVIKWLLLPAGSGRSGIVFPKDGAGVKPPDGRARIAAGVLSAWQTP